MTEAEHQAWEQCRTPAEQARWCLRRSLWTSIAPHSEEEPPRETQPPSDQSA